MSSTGRVHTMTPKEIRNLRLELELTVDELAFALNMTEAELLAIEEGLSDAHLTPRFIQAMDALEERIFGMTVGA